MAGTKHDLKHGGRSATRTATAREMALEQLVGMITSGEFTPGDRLPTERDLTRKLGYSRNTIREAIQSLELVGVLESRQGAGTFVRELDANLVLDATGFVSQLFRNEDVLELFEVRAILEAAAASLAASRCDLDGLAELRRHYQEMLDARTPESYLEADIAFHAHVASLAGNSTLGALIESFSLRTHPVRLYTQVRAPQAEFVGPAGLRNEHTSILEAIANRDPIAAGAAAVAHAKVAGSDWVRLHHEDDRLDQFG